MKAIIYRLTNTVNKKTYIGLTTRGLRRRWQQHCGSARRQQSTRLYNAIRKYGVDAFTREVLEETTVDLMNERERYWIAQLKPDYNMTVGGEGVSNPSPETRAKISAANRNRSPETRAKMSVASRNRSPETRAKMSAAARNRSPETRAKISAAARNRPPVSTETRVKMSAAKRNPSAETRAKMSVAARNRSPETRAKMSASAKQRCRRTRMMKRLVAPEVTLDVG